MDITPIEPDVERKALAMLARGDTKTAIGRELGMARQTVAVIAERNSDLLERMRETVINHRAENAIKILDKSQERILERLEARSPQDKLSELTGLMKTAYDQVRLEEGKPTSISSTAQLKEGEATPENLKAIVEALDAGDEIELTKVLWRKQ